MGAPDRRYPTGSRPARPIGAAPMMRVRSASDPAPGRLENEDVVFRFGPLVGLLDGATVPEGFETGCVHGPGWYVRHLAARMGLALAARPAATLMSSLAAAILAVRADHGGDCDLDHPGTPSATVCLLREGGDQVDYLVLCDSPLVLDTGGQVSVVSDERLDTAMAELRDTAAGLPGGGADPMTRFRHAVLAQRERMNRTHGYWVAAADPDAAYHAVTGTLPLRGPGAAAPGGAAQRRRVLRGRAVRPLRLGGVAGRDGRRGTGGVDRAGSGRRARSPGPVAPAQADRRRLGGVLRVRPGGLSRRLTTEREAEPGGGPTGRYLPPDRQSPPKGVDRGRYGRQTAARGGCGTA